MKYLIILFILISCDSRITVKFPDSETLSFCKQNKDTLPYAGGDGSETKPFQICNINQFNQINQNTSDWDSYFKISQNLDFTDKTITPIGDKTCTSYFAGFIDGQDFIISNVTISNPTEDNQGIFKCFNGEIKNIIFSNIDITGKNKVGIVSTLGESDSLATLAKIDNLVLAQSSFTGENDLGGVVGRAFDSSLKNITTRNVSLSASTGQDMGIVIGHSTQTEVLNSDIKGSLNGNWHIGGAVGYLADYSKIKNTTFETEVTGINSIGGLIGILDEGGEVIANKGVSVINGGIFSGGFIGAIWYCGSSWNDALIDKNIIETTMTTTSTYTGGFMGAFAGATDCLITQNKATVDITLGANRAGGFTGEIEDSNQLKQNYVIGNINANNSDSVGGFVGMWLGNNNVENSFTAVEITNPGTTNNGYFTGYHGGGSGTCLGCLSSNLSSFTTDYSPASSAILETDSNMKLQSTFTNEGYDFSTVWKMVTYPSFIYED